MTDRVQYILYMVANYYDNERCDDYGGVVESMSVDKAETAIRAALAQELEELKKDMGYFVIRITHNDIGLANIQARAMELGYQEAKSDAQRVILKGREER